MLSKLSCLKGVTSLGICRQFLSNSAPRMARFGQQGTTARSGIGIGRTAGPTIKERILGPTTGKPYIYGTYALAAGSAAGVAMLCFYGLGLSHEMGAIHKSSVWPEYVHDRLKLTYSYLGGSLVITAGAAVAASRSPAILRLASGNSLMTLFGSIAAVVGTGMLCRSIGYENSGPKLASWLLHCSVMGAVLAPMCFMGGPLLVRAAWYTAGIVGGLSATAACAPSEKFLNWGGPLAMGFGVVFVSSMGTWFIPPTTALGAGLMSIAMYGGLLLFSAFLLHDTQRVVKQAEMHPSPKYEIQPFDPINAQMSIYLDILNIFIRLAMIMAGQRKNK